MKKFINLDTAFFAQPWRRYLTLAVCFGWGGFEALLGNLIWCLIFVGLGAVAVWQFRQIDWSKYEGGHYYTNIHGQSQGWIFAFGAW